MMELQGVIFNLDGVLRLIKSVEKARFAEHMMKNVWHDRWTQRFERL